jgi:hypothetical protein
MIKIIQSNIEPPFKYHRFLDEAGDTTFYGKGKTQVIGSEGVSRCFILGMLKINEPLSEIRQRVLDLQNSIVNDPYFSGIPSITKKQAKMGYFLHAKDDIPEVRKMVFDLILSIDCSFEAVVARKIYSIYENKHKGKESVFYADILSHILKNKLNKYDKLVLNVAKKSKCTTSINLDQGWELAVNRSKKHHPEKEHGCKVVFNVQDPSTEALINLADYFCWSIQRVFERGETRYYDYICDKIASVVDIYDNEKFPGSGNYYNRRNKLTKENHLK